MQLILVRHGETLWNREGRVQGTSDIDLSDVGRDQARRLARSLKDQAVGAIFASPLRRAYQTAEFINEYHNREIQVAPELMEMDQGDFEGRTFKEIMAGNGEFLKRWISDPASVTMPNGESFTDVQARAWRVVEKVMACRENTIVVSHNFTIAAILCKVRNISLSQFRSTCVDTASKTVITCEDGKAVIDLMNDRGHLDQT